MSAQVAALWGLLVFWLMRLRTNYCQALKY